MTAPPPTDPPFDPRWLDLLAEACRHRSRGFSPVEDLFLERRLEARVVVRDGEVLAEESRSEGAAVRRRAPSGDLLVAATGTTARSVADLRGHLEGSPSLASARPVPAPEMDAPRGWREWARSRLTAARVTRGTFTFLERRAVVVRPGAWVAVAGPQLVRGELEGDERRRLLATWGHPLLGTWISELAAPAPGRTWSPDAGTRWPVVMTDGTGGVLFHELVGHLLEGDLVEEGASPLASLAGASVAPPGLDLVDDPTRTDLPGAFDHDDEGEPAGPVDLITRGRLTGLICDRRRARRLGTAAGRGRRSGWDRPPTPRLSNLVMRPGTTDPGELERSMRRGLVVTRLAGATVDPVSARLVLRVERGWEVRSGRRRRPLGPCELVGEALKVLAGLDPGTGSDATPDWRLGWCVKNGVSLPTGSESSTLLVRELEVL